MRKTAKLNADARYNKKHPVITVRLDNEDMLKLIDKIIRQRGKWQSGFNRQKYIHELIEDDLKRLDLI